VAADFTIRVTGPNPFREDSQSWRAGQIVAAMSGCRVESIVCALTAYERDDTPKGVGDPARWLSHFAGLESESSGKALSPWIEIVHVGEVVRSLSSYRELLRVRSEAVSCR
jgi:hypothetical protein